MKALNVLALILVIVGALNWGLVGAARFNLVSALFGDSIVAAIVYVLVGLAGVYHLLQATTSSRPAMARASVTH